MRRRQKRLANMAQGALGFDAPEAERPAQPKGGAHFLEDSPEALHVGHQRLEQYLMGAGMKWVIALRREMARLDYTALEVAYYGYGRRPFHPRTILGLIVYGVILRQWTLRELEQLAVRDVGAWWICGGHQPDHSTIGKFVQLHAETLSAEFFHALVQWVIQRLKLRVGTAAIDGTVIESAASRWQAIRVEAAKLAAERACAAASADPENTELAQRAEDASRVAQVAQQRKAAREQVGKQSETVQVTPSDIEAVIQPRKDGAIRPAYKATSMMHESGVLLGQYVDPSSETASVKPLMAEHQALFDAPPDALLVDGGFHQGALLEHLAEQNINVLCPSGRTLEDDDWEKKGAAGRFPKNKFAYEAASDTYRCPGGATLRSHGRSKDGAGREYQIYRTSACQGCAVRLQCTKSKTGRSIKRYASDAYKEAMAQVLEQPRARAHYRRRMLIGEPIHGYYQCRQGLRRFHRSGLINVRAEFALHGIAFNLRKVLAMTGIFAAPALVFAQTAVGWRVAVVWIVVRATGRADGK